GERPTSHLTSVPTGKMDVPSSPPDVARPDFRHRGGVWLALASSALALAAWLIFFPPWKSDAPAVAVDAVKPAPTVNSDTSGAPPIALSPRETAETPSLDKPIGPVPGRLWENTLGMKFAPVPGTDVLFGVGPVRVQDYQAFATVARRELVKPDFEQASTHPVVNVNWADANAFCAWLTADERSAGRLGADQFYRLPTDAEWSVGVGLGREPGVTPKEKDGRIRDVFPWGTQWPPPPGAGNYAGEESGYTAKLEGFNDGYPRTSPIGSFPPNKFGLHDMGGNVWQWCDDFYDGKAGARVLRGGSFVYYDADNLLSSLRISAQPNGRYGDIGFRVVIVLGPAGVVKPLPARGPKQ
ncbi:MAG TPA: SUMF1/EgtB/PvdO family nonheme iron enzyme, partial [Opitutaceae bacterium]|nr:SUMF1/EgtB/PvdO family nonheme iron enzyme [Opitutaceae bacterium]